MGVVEGVAAVMEDGLATSAAVGEVRRSVTSVTALDISHGSAVRLTAATSAMASAISQGIVHGHLMNLCAITVARVGT